MVKTIGYNNSQTLAYAEYGDPHGWPILIQHGMIASIYAREHNILQCLINAGARLINIARPGYGESSPYGMANVGEWGKIVSVLVDELNLQQFDVFGISSGAPYSYAIAHSLPSRVKNLYILSGTPALYHDAVLAHWPYPVNKNATLAEMQSLAQELFFSHLSQADLQRDDIKDSMMNNCFGIGQDLRIRCLDWGFELSQVKSRVIMRHSRADEAVPFITAQITAGLLPDCRLEIRDNDPHFSQEVLNDFIETVLTKAH